LKAGRATVRTITFQPGLGGAELKNHPEAGRTFVHELTWPGSDHETESKSHLHAT